MLVSLFINTLLFLHLANFHSSRKTQLKHRLHHGLPRVSQESIIPPRFLAWLLIYTISKTLTYKLSVYIFHHWTDMWESNVILSPPFLIAGLTCRHTINDHVWTLKPVRYSSFLSAMDGNVIGCTCDSFYIMKRKPSQDPTYMPFLGEWDTIQVYSIEMYTFILSKTMCWG